MHSPPSTSPTHQTLLGGQSPVGAAARTRWLNHPQTRQTTDQATEAS